MTMRQLLPLILAAPISAFAAATPSADIFGFAGAASFKSTDADDPGDAFEPDGIDAGVRASFNLTPNFFVAGEYTYTDTDGNFFGTSADLRIHETRGGGGLRFAVLPQLTLGAYALYVYQDARLSIDGFSASDDLNGYNVGGLAQFQATPAVQIYGRVGYLQVSGGDSDGDESDQEGVDLNVGASWALTPVFGLFAEYRYTGLEDGTLELDYNSFRGGVRLAF